MAGDLWLAHAPLADHPMLMHRWGRSPRWCAVGADQRASSPGWHTTLHRRAAAGRAHHMPRWMDGVPRGGQPRTFSVARRRRLTRAVVAAGAGEEVSPKNVGPKNGVNISKKILQQFEK